jgi:hypothetical protein
MGFLFESAVLDKWESHRLDEIPIFCYVWSSTCLTADERKKKEKRKILYIYG